MKNKIAKIMILVSIGLVFISQGGMALEPKKVINSTQYWATYNDDFFTPKGYAKPDLNRTHGAILQPLNFREFGYENFERYCMHHAGSGDTIEIRYPNYVIELQDTAIKFIPKSAISAICKRVNDPSYGSKLKIVDETKEDILNELKNAGVKRIYITACGYIVNSYCKSNYDNNNPLYHSEYQEFALDLQKMADKEQINSFNFKYILKIGIFDPLNVKVCFPEKNEPDTLNTVDKMFGCYRMVLEVDKIGQFYLVTMPDSETIIVNQVIIANETIMQEITKRLINASTLDKGLEDIRHVVKDLNLKSQPENKGAIRRLIELIQPVLNIQTKK